MLLKYQYLVFTPLFPSKRRAGRGEFLTVLKIQISSPSSLYFFKERQG